jgi:hypothetical protein
MCLDAAGGSLTEPSFGRGDVLEMAVALCGRGFSRLATLRWRLVAR